MRTRHVQSSLAAAVACVRGHSELRVRPSQLSVRTSERRHGMTSDP